MDKLNLNIDNLANQVNKVKSQVDKAEAGEKGSFKDLLKDFVGDVNNMQRKADEAVDQLAAGEVTDVHDVMVKVEEAHLSFNLMMEIRNKIVEGYKEVLRTQV